jgi:hypothetical protein
MSPTGDKPVLTVVPDAAPEPAPLGRPATGDDFELDSLPEGVIDPADQSLRPNRIVCRAYRERIRRWPVVSSC